MKCRVCDYVCRRKDVCLDVGCCSFGVVCLFLLVGRWGVGELRVVMLLKS